MESVDEQPPNFKHHCRVCKKGFMCGRALGGHMRAHGIGDENMNLDDDDDDQVSDWEGGSERTGNKRMYQLRTNPNRLKSCRSCENCGKEFLCWKSFLEHGKCSSDDAYESHLTSFESDGEDDGERRGVGWSKRKRSMRSKVGDLSSSASPTSEENDLLLANWLVQLANTIVDPMPWPEESSSSASREEERRDPTTFYGRSRPKGLPSSNKGLFECKACKKVFNSHQALGGHRASHKKVKGCFAAKQDEYQTNMTLLADDDGITPEDFISPTKSTTSFQFEQGRPLVGSTKKKSKVHECSICHRVFSSGQALGGHKRCHWIVSNSQNASPPNRFPFQEPMHHQHEPQSTNLAISTYEKSLLDPLKYESDNNMNKNNNRIENKVVEDEADSKVKLAKLSDLNDFKETGTSGNAASQWLQIGFGSTAEAVVDA